MLLVAHRPTPGTYVFRSVSEACVIEPCSPLSAPLPPRPPRKVAPRCSAGSAVLRRSPTSPERSRPRYGLWPLRTGLDRSTKTHRRVAVGTTVTRGPPHGPVLARLAHTVLTLDVWRRSAHWDRDVRCGQKEYGPQAAPESAPRSNGFVGSAAEAGVAINAARLSETLSFAARCPVRRGIGNTPLPPTVATSGYPQWTRAYAVAAAP